LWNDAYFVSAIRIEMDDMNALPVARLAFPTQRITLAGGLVEGCTTIKDVLVEIAVTLSRRDEADRAVTMLMVIPAHQFGDPVARGAQGVEWLKRIGRTVLQRFEQRF
jgi:hypothetical protein